MLCIFRHFPPFNWAKTWLEMQSTLLPSGQTWVSGSLKFSDSWFPGWLSGAASKQNTPRFKSEARTPVRRQRSGLWSDHSKLGPGKGVPPAGRPSWKQKEGLGEQTLLATHCRESPQPGLPCWAGGALSREPHPDARMCATHAPCSLLSL